MYDKAPTAEQLGREAKNETEPASDTGVNTPIMRPETRLWVPANIDDLLSDAKKAYGSIRSAYRRNMGMQGLDIDAAHFEKQLKTKQALIDSYEMLRANKHNAQFFEHKNQFDDWIKRKLKGGLEARMADNELVLRRKGRVMQEGLLNIHDQVRATELTEAEKKELHIQEQERKWQQLQEELDNPVTPGYQQQGFHQGYGQVATGFKPTTTEPVTRGMQPQAAKPVQKPAPEPAPKPQQPKENTRQQQLVGELEQLKGLKGAGDVRNVLSHIRNRDDYSLRYGDKQLTIKGGRVDPDQLQDFVNYSKGRVPKHDKQQRVAGVRERGVMPGKQSGKAYQSAMKNRMQELQQTLPDDNRDAQKMGYALKALGNPKASVDITFGDGQTLQIKNGEANPKTLNEFVRAMEGETEQYQLSLIHI